MSFFPTRAAFAQTLAALPGPHEAAIEAARERQSQLTKPAGSLGRLEDIAIFMAGWQNRTIPAIDKGRTAIFAGNHGFMVHGVSAFPVSVTQAMVANYGAGGAAINALAGFAGMDLTIVPLELDRPTVDFTQGPAMSEEECLAALNAGAAAVTPDLDLLTVGEMGIGNTASASALCAHSLGGSAAHWVGPGSGLDPEGVARKAAVVGQALALHADAPRDAFETLRRLGGREVAAMAGATLAARAQRIPVVLDGFINCAALVPLFVDNPAIVDHCLAGHCSAEPGHVRILETFGLSPLLSLGLRLGEGSGAALAVPIIRAALAAHAQMATFADAGVEKSL